MYLKKGTLFTGDAIIPFSHQKLTIILIIKNPGSVHIIPIIFKKLNSLFELEYK